MASTISYNHGAEPFQNEGFNSSIKAFADVSIHPIDPELVAMSKYWMADAYYRLKKYRESISYYKDFISSPPPILSPKKSIPIIIWAILTRIERIYTGVREF